MVYRNSVEMPRYTKPTWPHRIRTAVPTMQLALLIYDKHDIISQAANQRSQRKMNENAKRITGCNNDKLK